MRGHNSICSVIIAVCCLLPIIAPALEVLPIEHDWTIAGPGGAYGLQGYRSRRSGSVTWVLVGSRSVYVPLPCPVVASMLVLPLLAICSATVFVARKGNNHSTDLLN